MARTVIGLDIGHHTVRAVAVRRQGRTFEVVAHAAVKRRDDFGEVRPLAVVVGELDSLLPLAGHRTAVTISDLTTLVRYVATIPLPPDRLQRLLRLEMLQHLEGGELAADTFPVPLAADELIHCCVMAQPTSVYAALAELKTAGVTPNSVQFAPIAAFNATLPMPPVQDDQLALLVDIGGTSTGVSLFGERRLLACRQLAMGGDTFTKALAEASSLVIAQAEAAKLSGERKARASVETAPVKRELQLAEEVAEPSASAAIPFELDLSPSSPSVEIVPPLSSPMTIQQPSGSTSGTRALAEDFLSSVEDVDVAAPGQSTVSIAQLSLGPELTKTAEVLYAQLVSSMAWFKTQIHARDLTLAKVVLVGGGAGLVGLDGYLQRRFGVPVERLDPFDGCIGAVPDHPHEYAAACGLALSALGARQGAVRLDLMPDGVIRRRLWQGTLIWPYVAAACLLLAGILSVWTMLNEQSANEASSEAYAFHQRTADDLKRQLAGLEQEKAGLSEDLRAIAGRIYAGRDLLYTVRALKERTLQSKELWVTRLETLDIGQDATLKDPAAATASRRMQAAPVDKGRRDAGRHDTAIDRGAVAISGLVKFDASPSDVVLNSFFEQYMEWVAAWKPSPDAQKLFRDVRVIQHVITHDPLAKGKLVKAVDPAEAGRFPFELRFFFQPTQLDEITTIAGSPGKVR